MKTSPAKCVLFDLDGTLYQSPEYNKQLDTEIARFVSEFLNITIDVAQVLLRDGKRKFGTLTRTLENLNIDREFFFEEMAARIDTHIYLSRDPSVENVLQQLRVRGFKIGLVSNSGRALVRKVLAAIGLSPERFDVVVTSSDAAPKPSKEPFLVALKQVGSDFENSIYVGDRDEQELRPAKELGIKTVLIKTTAQKPKWADKVVESLSELPDLIDEVCKA